MRDEVIEILAMINPAIDAEDEDLNIAEDLDSMFAKTIREAAHGAHKRLRQVEFKTQAPDHPILWAAEESYYLKFYIFQVCEEL